MSQVILEKPNNTKRRESLIRQTDSTQTNLHQPSAFSHPEDPTNTCLSLRYQVLLLNNGKSQDVKVQETDLIDFRQVEDYLRHGGSVFITSKKSQKLAPLKENKIQPNKNDAGKSTIWFS
jgi:hypothetical protein